MQLSSLLFLIIDGEEEQNFCQSTTINFLSFNSLLSFFQLFCIQSTDNVKNQDEMQKALLI